MSWWNACALIRRRHRGVLGEPAKGQLGSDDWGEDNTPVETAQAVPGVHGAVQVSTGLYTSCAVLDTGDVSCWGESDVLGGLGGAGAIPIDLDDAVEVAVGMHHACARRAGGSVSCWGSNQAGLLGTGTMDPVDGPVEVVGLTEVVSIAAGRWHTCAIRADRSLWCWGEAMEGALGVQEETFVPAATPMAQLENVERVSLGMRSSAAVLTGGLVVFWGDNPVKHWTDHPFVEASGIGDITLAPNAAHVCGLRQEDGAVTCWGANVQGEVGDGTTEQRYDPTEVAW